MNQIADLTQEIWMDGAIVDTKTIDNDNIISLGQ